MNLARGSLLSLAYILGLLSTAIVGLPTRNVSWQEYSLLIASVIGIGIICAIALPRIWRTGPRARLWLTASFIAVVALVYVQLRLPQPELNDISKLVSSFQGTMQGQVVTIQGKVETVPRLTRSLKGQFWLEATQLNELESNENRGATTRGVTGKLYVTVPLLQSTGLFPGQTISVTGVLYKPKPAANPGGFDFATYLAKEGAFAGLSGRQVSFPDENQQPTWGWWMLRERIIQAQVRQLESPAGPLLSSIVLGRKAVDLPYDIRDLFISTGFAHILAASGFHVSLILGSVLALTKPWGTKAQFGIGLTALLIYVGLTGLQPSVLRAAIMGLGALVALLTHRQVKPLGSLLLAATILLIINPLWIWDLGFQLSFLATLGLLVTVPPLVKHLDWLPSVIAALFAVPLAALLWTLPLQLYVFGMIAPYSVVVNIIATPLISLISLGGFLSALVALISPLAGSAIAGLLYYPLQGLLELVRFFNALPGSSVALGTISLAQLLLLYGLIGITCISSRVQLRGLLAGMIALTIVVLPIWQTQLEQFQVTVLAADQEQVVVIQDHGQVTLINSGETDTANFTILPFLQKQGINQVDWAVAVDSQPLLRSGWVSILESLPVKRFYDLAHSEPLPNDTQAIAEAVQSQNGIYEVVSTEQRLAVGSTGSGDKTTLELIKAQPPVVQLQIKDQVWLLLADMAPDEQNQFAQTGNLPQIQVLLWSGEPLTPRLVEGLKPEVAIALAEIIEPQAAKLLQNAQVELYWTGRDGAIQWTPEQGFETTLEANRTDAALL
ncbi:MAG: ComEC/Rec2 family competence protein [Coleofasciculus sp. G1-WW12-02]|uniref:ComEC/Rec2 family competence protein n=1 Tax=Coleofasciculus sp. G1-WW12-02 TaxID=3068483 RepID=UPI0032F1576A